MVIGGLQKNSFIDYPGKISCVVFVSGCNFHCPYCHNPRLAKNNPAQSFSLNGEEVFEFLEMRKPFLDGVVISGGEPTLHKDLVYLCERIKKMEYPVKLDTNGSRPQALKELIKEKLVDYIAMDIKTDPQHYSLYIKRDCDPNSIISCIQIIMESDINYEFRTTCVKPIVNADAIENIARIIQGCKLYALQRFNHAEVLDPQFFEDVDAAFDEDEFMSLRSLAAPWVEKCIIR